MVYSPKFSPRVVRSQKAGKVISQANNKLWPRHVASIISPNATRLGDFRMIDMNDLPDRVGVVVRWGNGILLLSGGHVLGRNQLFSSALSK
jgi:hypothetical protein